MVAEVVRFNNSSSESTYQFHASSLSVIRAITQPFPSHSRGFRFPSRQDMRGLEAHIFISYPRLDSPPPWMWMLSILINQFAIADTNLLCTTKIVSVSFRYAPHHFLHIFLFFPLHPFLSLSSAAYVIDYFLPHLKEKNKKTDFEHEFLVYLQSLKSANKRTFQFILNDIYLSCSSGFFLL